MTTGNMSKKQQPYQRADNSRRPLMVHQRSDNSTSGGGSQLTSKYNRVLEDGCMFMFCE